MTLARKQRTREDGKLTPSFSSPNSSFRSPHRSSPYGHYGVRGAPRLIAARTPSCPLGTRACIRAPPVQTRRTVYLICKHLEHSDVSCLQGRRPGAHEENAEGGEVEAARGLSGSLTLVEDADTTMAAVANFRDKTLVHEVQSTRKCHVCRISRRQALHLGDAYARHTWARCVVE